MNATDLCEATLNRLCKWRMFFAGWQLGTRPKEDPEAAAVRDTRELLMLLRVEQTALVAVLVGKGVFTVEDYLRHQTIEAEHLMRSYEKSYPGFAATDDGMAMQMPDAVATMRRMHFKP